MTDRRVLSEEELTKIEEMASYSREHGLDDREKMTAELTLRFANTIRDLQRQVSDKDRVILNCYREIRHLRDERDKYRRWFEDIDAECDRMDRVSDKIWRTNELLREQLAKHAPRQEEANVPTRETT